MPEVRQKTCYRNSWEERTLDYSYMSYELGLGAPIKVWVIGIAPYNMMKSRKEKEWTPWRVTVLKEKNKEEEVQVDRQRKEEATGGDPEEGLRGLLLIPP